jgi:DNA-binding beta-propeller fold protein YncE
MAEQSTDAVVSTQAAQAGKRTTPARNFAARLFGYDVFISFALGPSPRGSLSYASDLARRLRERDFTVFFSEDEAPPGEQLDSTLLKALESSRLLVVIANRGTLAEPRWVRKEVEEYRRRHPDRPVIPISVGGALLDSTLAGQAQEWLAFQDKIWLDEAADACETGIASAALIERLATAPTRVRSNVSWRRVVRGVIAVLAALAIALGIAAKMATDSAERARAELRRSISLRMTGEAPAMLTGARAGGDEQAVQQALVARALVGPTAEVDAAMLSTLKAMPQLSKVVNTGLPIGSMAFSHDGTHIVTGRRDGTLQFWNATNLQPIGAPLKGIQHGISTLALSADGQTIVSGSEDGTLQRWNANSREPIGEPLKAHKNESPGWAELGVQTVAISPDGSRIATSGWDWTLKLWDAKTGKQDGEPLMEQEGYVYSGLAFSKDGSRIVAAGNDPTIRLWNAKTRRVIGRLDMSDVLKGNDDVVSVAFSPSSPNGSIIVAGTREQGVWLWDAGTGQRRTFEGKPSGNIATVAFSADGARILAGTEEGTVQMWDAITRKPIGALLAGAKDSQTRIAFSADGARIASGDENGRLRLWDTAGGHSMPTVLSAGDRQEPDAVFGATGALMALRRDGDKVELRSMQRGQLICRRRSRWPFCFAVARHSRRPNVVFPAQAWRESTRQSAPTWTAAAFRAW